MKAIFSGDVLFGFGCGRLFEGSFQQGFESLQRFLSLPADFKIYCTHEYTLTNIQFLKSLPVLANRTDFPSLVLSTQHELKSAGRTVPLSLREQLEWNPFLRAKSIEEFQDLRTLRNQF